MPVTRVGDRCGVCHQRPVDKDGMCTQCWNLAAMHGPPEPVDPLTQLEQLARQHLVANGVNVEQIIRVEEDCILYRNASGKAMTAWKWDVNGRMQITFEPGFPLEPGPEMIPRALRTPA